MENDPAVEDLLRKAGFLPHDWRKTEERTVNICRCCCAYLYLDGSVWNPWTGKYEDAYEQQKCAGYHSITSMKKRFHGKIPERIYVHLRRIRKEG